ncbi:unnamed protein product [Gongylonema pulchrum]|uniref:I/LWEQ domain-containing protein n=1 Tax=Gongylonema pulchrum TaxID=637853 RepID=A0A183DWF0_9BILA|nr:unnamed protein product [Gongylonema pulchrum]
MCLNLPVGSSDITAEAIGAELEQEMKRMDAAIQRAVAMIEEMQKKSRATDSGIRLEVNEKILDSCNQLMAAIVQLVARSRAMQEEIVAAGHGTVNPNEFYKRNHQWTEGLLSAAKAIGVAATVLVQSADGVVSGQGKLEHLLVAAQEVAAKDLDFSHYSLHDTKKQEMESQVRVLELEDKLTRERAHLAQLRKQHYQLAQIVENEDGAEHS